MTTRFLKLLLFISLLALDSSCSSRNEAAKLITPTLSQPSRSQPDAKKIGSWALQFVAQVLARQRPLYPAAAEPMVFALKVMDFTESDPDRKGSRLPEDSLTRISTE